MTNLHTLDYAIYEIGESIKQQTDALDKLKSVSANYDKQHAELRWETDMSKLPPDGEQVLVVCEGGQRYLQTVKYRKLMESSKYFLVLPPLPEDLKL